MSAREDARARLVRDLEAALPEVEGAPAARVFDGEPANVQPCCVWVEHLPSAFEDEPDSTCGHKRSSWTYQVVAAVRRSDAAAARSDLYALVEAVELAVLADPTLGGAVSSAVASPDSMGIGAGDDRMYGAAAMIGVKCEIHDFHAPMGLVRLLRG